MEPVPHQFCELFRQLGLPDDLPSMERFIARHRLTDGLPLADAPFWTPQQARFLREKILEDADWAHLIDRLDVRLRT